MKMKTITAAELIELHQTLSMMGGPGYVNMMVNPEKTVTYHWSSQGNAGRSCFAETPDALIAKVRTLLATDPVDKILDGLSLESDTRQVLRKRIQNAKQ